MIGKRDMGEIQPSLLSCFLLKAQVVLINKDIVWTYSQYRYHAARSQLSDCKNESFLGLFEGSHWTISSLTLCTGAVLKSLFSEYLQMLLKSQKGSILFHQDTCGINSRVTAFAVSWVTYARFAFPYKILRSRTVWACPHFRGINDDTDSDPADMCGWQFFLLSVDSVLNIIRVHCCLVMLLNIPSFWSRKQRSASAIRVGNLSCSHRVCVDENLDCVRAGKVA